MGGFTSGKEIIEQADKNQDHIYFQISLAPSIVGAGLKLLI